MKSFSTWKKVAAAGLLVSLTGSGLVWATFGKEVQSQGSRTAVLSALEVDDVARGMALYEWRQYMRQIGWPEEKVQVAHPAFVDQVTTKEQRADGGWTVVFDGTRTGELRRVTLQLDDRGNETGEALVEWSDLCTIETLTEDHHQ